jgi:phage gp46-like protein
MDIALYRPGAATANILVEAGELLADEGLLTAVLASLFCDARARTGDEPPDGTSDQRGWWGDQFDEPGDRMGSRLWLLDRSLRTPYTLKRIEDYAREALSWMVADGLATKVQASAAFEGDEGYRLNVVMWAPARGTEPTGWRFFRNWEAQLVEVSPLVH